MNPDLVLTFSSDPYDSFEIVFSNHPPFLTFAADFEVLGKKLCPVRNRPTSLHQIATVGDIFQTFSVYEEDNQLSN